MEAVISGLNGLSLTQMSAKQLPLVKHYSTGGKMRGKKVMKRGKRARNKLHRTNTRHVRRLGRIYRRSDFQRGGGWMGVALAVGRKALPVIARGGIALGRKLLPKVVKHLPRTVLSSAVQAVGEDVLEKELKKRAANRYSFLGSIRFAASERLREQREWATKQRLRLQKRENALIARRNAPRLRRLRRAKEDAVRKLHVTRALTRQRKKLGLPSSSSSSL